MFSIADKTAFCILSKTWVVFRPTSDCALISVSFDHPPSTSMMILYWCTSYPLYCSFSSHLNGPYFIVFSSLFFSRLLIHGQLISIVVNFLLTWFTNLASTWLARTSWWTAYTGTSYQASTCTDSYTGFGITGEYHGGTPSRRSWSCKIS